MAEEIEGGKKKSGLLKWIILAVLLLLLAGGGYFAYLKFFVAAPAETPPTAPAEGGEAPGHAEPAAEAPAKEEAHGEAASGHGGSDGHGGGKAAPAQSLVTVPTFVVNLADPSGRRYLKLSMDLEVKGGPEAIQGSMSKIRDALLMLLSSKSVEELAGVEGKIILRKDVADRINQVLGKPVVLRVYFTDFVIQ
ncbi:flagellar basal body-associated FliL family protein [Desulfovibrio sulfodismutans]|uniref:Flagellar protein FliL n=1 Tax=Desulfolutivibrio sulfodismutans TaxID=63561 RepID=A0A7K3NRI7_9BACT|nr:flagellar basal body-associated FliL family protein [Desulfolutivibrio sulfodismutans]NDY58812.1 flagellar basal body-associated FliL family protein [Desulfolutivibrio sulfodismutans]QLA13135.1 flagellar basal body protein FliL [Desulfolutivibrio sulfodismutans DSM 3696]